MNNSEIQGLYYFCSDCKEAWIDAFEPQYGRCDSECAKCSTPYTPFDSREDWLKVAGAYL